MISRGAFAMIFFLAVAFLPAIFRLIRPLAIAAFLQQPASLACRPLPPAARPIG